MHWHLPNAIVNLFRQKKRFLLIILIEQVSWNNFTNLAFVESNPLTFELCVCLCVHFNCFKLIMSLNYIKSVLHERKNHINKYDASEKKECLV